MLGEKAEGQGTATGDEERIQERIQAGWKFGGEVAVGVRDSKLDAFEAGGTVVVFHDSNGRRDNMRDTATPHCAKTERNKVVLRLPYTSKHLHTHLLRA